jgi:high-affinity nickel-transport protein
MADGGILALAGLGIALGLRHGIDWDHIAAITDITSSAVPAVEIEEAPTSVLRTARTLQLSGGVSTGGQLAVSIPAVRDQAQIQRLQRRIEVKRGMFLASMYALGHASLVVVLGLLAIWASTVLPDWIDPIMERLVGVTLLALGAWIVYSLVRYGREFRLQSRWMVFFSLIRRGWAQLKGKVTGERVEHTHDFNTYGPRTAFGIGMLHGVGAETGSQAVLLAGAAGATTRATGSVLLLFFTVGLLISNTLVAALSATGFVSAAAKRNLYVVIGVFAAIFSLVVGFLFVTGQGTALPDLQGILNHVFGGVAGSQ